MKFKPLIATTLIGMLSSCVVATAETHYNLRADRWDGGAVGLGNLKGGGNGRFSLNQGADQSIWLQYVDSTNNWATGMLFDRSSYHNVVLSSTTIAFAGMRSENYKAAGLRLQNNSLNLRLGDSQEIDMEFYSIWGGQEAAGIWTENGTFTLGGGTIQFSRSIASNGPAYGIVNTGSSSGKNITIEYSAQSNQAAKIKYNDLLGGQSYGVRLYESRGDNVLTINSNGRSSSGEATGLYFNRIDASRGNAALFMSSSTTNNTLKMQGYTAYKANSITATNEAFVTNFTGNNGNIILNSQNGAPKLEVTSVVAGSNAYGLYFKDDAGTATIQVDYGSQINIGSIRSQNSTASGISSDKALDISLIGNNSTIHFGSITGNGAQGIRAFCFGSLSAVNGAHVTFDSLSGSYVYGIMLGDEGLGSREYGRLNLVTNGNGIIEYKNMQATNQAVGISGGEILFEPQIGGRVVFKNIQANEKAIGIRFTNNLVFNHTKDPYQSGRGTGMTFESISDQSFGAIGIFAEGESSTLTFKGGGTNTFKNINHTTTSGWFSTGGSIGILSTDSSQTTMGVISGNHLIFESLNSKNLAYGIKTNSLTLRIEDGSMLKFGTIRGEGEVAVLDVSGNLDFALNNGNTNINSAEFVVNSVGAHRQGAGAYGIKTTGSSTIALYRGSSFGVNRIYSQYGKAIGIQTGNLSLALAGGTMTFNNIVSEKEANGIYFGNSIQITTHYGQTNSLIFNLIKSQDGNALGIYTANQGATISLHGERGDVIFRDISHFGTASNQFAGGIVSDGAKLTLSLLDGNHFQFDKVASNSKAYGVKVKSLSLRVESGGGLSFGKISGRSDAYGLYSQSGSVDIYGGGVVTFSDVFSSNSTRYGIYTPNSTLAIRDTSLIFGSKSDSIRYGIYNNINRLVHSIGNTTISINGANSVGIYGAVETRINLQGGRTLTISAKNGSTETKAINGNVSIYMQGSGSRLVLDSGNGSMNRLDVTTSSTVSLLGASTRNTSSLQLRQLEVSSWNGSGANVMLYANTAATINTNNGFDGKAYQSRDTQSSTGGSDRIVINGTSQSTSSQVQDNTLKVALGGVSNTIKHVVLAEVGGNAKDKVIFNGLSGNNQHTTIQTETDFSVGNITITRYDDGDKAYYVGKIPTASSFRINTQRAGRVAQAQNASASVVSANFNNLNKRMGELRENSHNHGVWARVFSGEVQSDFGYGSSSTYTTVQAGYDYNLSSDLDSNSYLGFALSYLNNKTNNIEGESKGNGAEAGVYFAYVKDSGIYTDTIAKIAYVSNANSSFIGYELSDTNNVSFILSQEIGYQAEVVDGFYLTPQFETTYAYLGGSEMNASSNGVTTLTSTQDATNTWRNRIGLQASYKLKNEDKKFNASFYAMGSYTYDYVSGGDTTYKAPGVADETKPNTTKSDGRFVLNVGSNIDIKDATRLYLDFEKSFGGKINTNYQINVGVRYSFGEKISK